MIRRFTWLDAMSLVILAGTVLATVAAYDRLPDPMPSHFRFDGTVDGWMPRIIGAWIVPVVALALGGLLRVGGYSLPRASRGGLRASPVHGLTFILVAVFGGLQLFLLRAAIDSANPRMSDALWVLGGMALVGVGQLLPRTRRNAIVGFRTAWTLASDENWARAQRVAGYALTFGGAAMAIAGGLGHPGLAFATLLLMGLAPILWSIIAARRGR